jgi:hypothetical protein
MPRRKKIKRGADPVRSMATTGRNAGMDRMSMNRKVTRDVYTAREIEQSAPTQQERTQANKRELDKIQSGYKPIRASQTTDLNK